MILYSEIFYFDLHNYSVRVQPALLEAVLVLTHLFVEMPIPLVLPLLFRLEHVESVKRRLMEEILRVPALVATRAHRASKDHAIRVKFVA